MTCRREAQRERPFPSQNWRRSRGTRSIAAGLCRQAVNSSQSAVTASHARVPIRQSISSSVRSSGASRAHRESRPATVRALADREGHHRLNVEERGGRVAIAEAEIPIPLQRDADEAGHRVLRPSRGEQGSLGSQPIPDGGFTHEMRWLAPGRPSGSPGGRLTGRTISRRRRQTLMARVLPDRRRRHPVGAGHMSARKLNGMLSRSALAGLAAFSLAACGLARAGDGCRTPGTRPANWCSR